MRYIKPLSDTPFLSAKPAHTAVLLAFCAFGAGTAQATCTQTGNTINCTSPATDTTNQLFTITTPTATTAIANNWIMNGARFQLQVDGADATFTGSNVTATNGIGGNNGVIHVSTTGAGSGSNATLTITNATIEQLMGGHGLAADSTNTGGNASVTATDTHVTIAAAAGANRYGIVANNSNSIGGDSSVTVIRGSITAANDGPALMANTNSGNVDVKALGAGTITITGTGADANAIRGRNGGNGTVTVQNEQTLSSVVAALRTIAGNGQTTVTNSGTIQTSGTDGYGIYSSSSGTGAIDITNQGALTTGGLGSHAIYASGGGQITIDNHAALTTTGNDSKGIAGNYSGTSGGITVNHHAGASITTSGSNSSGSGGYSLANGSAGILLSSTSTAVGDLLAIVDGDITTSGSNRAGGVFVNNVGVGNATIRATGNILTTDTTGPYSYGLSANIGNQSTSRGDASIYYTNAAGSVETRANDSTALYAYIDVNANGNTRIENAGTVKTSGDGLSVGLWVRVLNGSGSATIVNSGSITTTGAQTGSGSASGIRADTVTGNVDLTNSGTISTQGNAASGIRVNTGNAATINVTNTGAITTAGIAAHGINVYALTNGNIDLTSSGNIQTSGSSTAGGIFINTSNAHINTDISGQITTAGTNSPAIELISQRNAEGTASNLLYFHDGVATVGTGSNGVSLWTGGSGSIGSGEVRVGANTLIDASRGLTAVQNFMPEDGLINISAGAQIIGNTAGVQAGSQRIVLNNSGNISALSDLAIENTAFPVVTQQMAISNQGIVTGYITLGDGHNTFSNAGQWNLRHFADSDGDQIRDTLAVAVSNFGTSGNNHITNSGVIALLGDNGQATTLDNTGEYATGYAANTMAAGGAVQGQILNVQTFTNSGTIDMGPANGAVGDVLLISGGNTPGVSGGGVYVANGGQLMLDTVLNEGGSNSQSDMLVVDSTRLGSAADKITVINVGGTGSLTNGNGIELVRVLDSANSAAGAFKLSGRLVSGVYEYDLYQGGVGTAAGDGNWYLRNLSVPAPRTETGVYLRNMAAASTMFMHTLHDRLGEPQYTDRYNTDTNGKVSSLWVRVTGDQTDGKAANGDIDLSTDTTLVQLGGDLARWSSNGQDRWHIGVMGAYGQSDTDADPTRLKTTNSGYKRTANGKVEGYSLGAYATWYGNQDKPTGPYVDLWGTYNWFDNKVQGNTLKEESYDSTGYTLSVEGGYAFIANEGDNRQWMIEPQAQLAYNSYSADDHYERSTNTWVRNGDSDGVIARLGARLYSRSKLNDNGIQPFVEANWWYNSAKYDLAFNGQSISDDTPDSTYELKAGLQGEVAKGWQLWGHIGGRWGENSYSRYEGMIGVKHQF